MPIIAKTKSARVATLAAGAALAASLATLPACGVFAARNQSTVAQGKYYAAGDPHYDEFFVGLFLLQVQMEQAPHLPELERLNLAHALALTPQASSDEVGQRLHEEALKLSRSGLRMRLDQNPASEKPESASAALRTSERPKDRQTAAFVGQIETSTTALLRSVGELKQADEALDGLELAAGGLDASVDKDFAAAPAGKQDEVKKNLADAHKLIALMKVRASEVRGESEQLLATVSKAVNTDDGSLGAPGTEGPSAEAAAEAAKAAEANAKKGTLKTKPKPPGAAPGAAPKPKRKAAPLADGDEPPKAPAKPSKAPPPPRDFEP
ncbi:MAG TPA: hypothetical protein VIK01_27625 [Polyangiaceae bacterium]